MGIAAVLSLALHTMHRNTLSVATKVFCSLGIIRDDLYIRSVWPVELKVFFFFSKGPVGRCGFRGGKRNIHSSRRTTSVGDIRQVDMLMPVYFCNTVIHIWLVCACQGVVIC